MTTSTEPGSVSDKNQTHSDERTSSGPGRIWLSGDSVEISTGLSADILSYTFANLGQYDHNKPIFVDALNPSNTLSASQTKSMVRKLIAGLKKHGLCEGDCVCLHAFNTIWYPLIWLAVIGAGGIIFGTNASAPSSELIHLLIITRTKFLITETASLKVAEQVASACGISPDHFFVLAKCDQPVPAGRQAFLKLLNHGESDWVTVTTHGSEISARTAAYCTTSGTTGLPKAARIPHSYVVEQARMIEHRLQSRTYQACFPSQLICLPVFHTFAAPISLVQPLRLGIKTYFLPRFGLDSFTEAVNKFDITETAIVPPILTALSRLSPADDSLSSLRYVLCAGAPIATELQSQLYPCLHPDATIAQVWGATELGWVSMFAPGEKDFSGSVGTLLPGIELKLLDGDTNRVSSDLVHGEALIHSPSAFGGYLNNAGATSSAFDDEAFYYTGDQIYIKDNKIYIDGRVKDTMKVNGWQVSPTEIEQVLLQHPGVADVAVVGVNAISKEGLKITRPRAYIVKQQDFELLHHHKLIDEELKGFVALRLVAYKRLTGGVVFVDAIPRSPTGKIVRRHLIAQ